MQAATHCMWKTQWQSIATLCSRQEMFVLPSQRHKESPAQWPGLDISCAADGRRRRDETIIEDQDADLTAFPQPLPSSLAFPVLTTCRVSAQKASTARCRGAVRHLQH